MLGGGVEQIADPQGLPIGTEGEFLVAAAEHGGGGTQVFGLRPKGVFNDGDFTAALTGEVAAVLIAGIKGVLVVVGNQGVVVPVGLDDEGPGGALEGEVVKGTRSVPSRIGGVEILHGGALQDAVFVGLDDQGMDTGIEIVEGSQ